MRYKRSKLYIAYIYHASPKNQVTVKTNNKTPEELRKYESTASMVSVLLDPLSECDLFSCSVCTGVIGKPAHPRPASLQPPLMEKVELLMMTVDLSEGEEALLGLSVPALSK